MTRDCYTRYYGSTEPVIKLDKNKTRIYETAAKEKNEDDDEDEENQKNGDVEGIKNNNNNSGY